MVGCAAQAGPINTGSSSAHSGERGSGPGAAAAASVRVAARASSARLESDDLLSRFGETSFGAVGELRDIHSVEVSDRSGRAGAQDRYDCIVAERLARRQPQRRGNQSRGHTTSGPSKTSVQKQGTARLDRTLPLLFVAERPRFPSASCAYRWDTPGVRLRVVGAPVTRRQAKGRHAEDFACFGDG